MIAETRSGDAGTGNHGGYFPGGAYLYEKDWTVPADIDERAVPPLLRRRLRRHDGVGRRCDRRSLRAAATASSPSRSTGCAPAAPPASRSPSTTARPRTAAGTPGRASTARSGSRASRRRTSPRDGIRFVTRSVAGDARVDVEVHVAGNSDGAAVVVELAARGVVAATTRADGPRRGGDRRADRSGRATVVRR